MKKVFQNAKLQVKMKGQDNPEGVTRTLSNVAENLTDAQIAIIKNFMQAITNDAVSEMKQTVANKLEMEPASAE
ncbi:hypothetical protein [Limosilactobacillus sp.]|uniref:DUF1659 domain-containing protein n=1 Tax=Limosilactobacillus sp. TaxID=2773925 RepID=UPI00345E0E49